MIIRTRIEWQGKGYDIEYNDADSFDDLPLHQIRQVYGLCFCAGKLVIGRRAKDGTWGYLGGHPKKGESLEQTLRREIREESNMDLLRFQPIGYQIVCGFEGEKEFQLRYCCIVEPIGEFTHDPDLSATGGIDAIQLIDPAAYRNYVEWGDIGDRLIERALTLFPALSLSRNSN